MSRDAEYICHRCYTQTRDITVVRIKWQYFFSQIASSIYIQHLIVIFLCSCCFLLCSVFFLFIPHISKMRKWPTSSTCMVQQVVMVGKRRQCMLKCVRIKFSHGGNHWRRVMNVRNQERILEAVAKSPQLGIWQGNSEWVTTMHGAH